MRTLIFIVGGLALLAIYLGVAKFAFGGAASAMRIAVLAFGSLWLVIAAANLWIGVTRAGYAFLDELPIFLLIFGIPVGTAGVIRWKFL